MNADRIITSRPLNDVVMIRCSPEEPSENVLPHLEERTLPAVVGFRFSGSDESLRKNVRLLNRASYVGMIGRRGADPFLLLHKRCWPGADFFRGNASVGSVINDLIGRTILERRFSVAEISDDKPRAARAEQDASFESLGFRFEAGLKEEAIITGREPAVVSQERTTQIIELAVKYLRHNSFMDASRLLGVLIKRRSDIPDLLLLKAFADMNLGCKEEAEEGLCELLARMPSHQEAANLLRTLRGQ